MTYDARQMLQESMLCHKLVVVANYTQPLWMPGP